MTNQRVNRTLLLYTAFFALAVWLGLDATKPARFTVALSVVFLPYFLLLRQRIPVAFPSTGVALVLAGVIGTVLVFLSPMLSDDVFRFVWEGRVLTEGYSPYTQAPTDGVLAPLRDGNWQRINNPTLTSVYPPLAQGLFVISAWLGGSIVAMKALALVLHLASVMLLARFVGDRGTIAPLALALNPLALTEAALNGHFDVAVGASVLGATMALGSARYRSAAIWMVAATGLKVLGVLLLPRLAKERWQIALLALAVVAALLCPLAMTASADSINGSLQFASRWRGNDLVFGWLQTAIGLFVEPHIANRLARVVVVATVAGVACYLAFHRRPVIQSIRLTVLVVLLLSPQVHPWYLLWLLPIEIIAQRLAGVVWTCLVLLAYVPVEQWLARGVWAQPTWTVALEYGLLAIVFLFELRREPDFFDPPMSRT